MFRKIIVPVLAGYMSVFSALPAYAQSDQENNNHARAVSVNGVGLNTTQHKDGFSSLSTSLTSLDFSDSDLLVVGGQNYSTAGRNDIDVGVKYLKGRSMIRATLAKSVVMGETDVGKEAKLSGGVDWDAALASYRGMDVSLLGDVSSLEDGRYVDFGVGTKLRFHGGHNAFFLYSDRSHSDSYRFGYMFLDDEKIASLVADVGDEKTVFSGFLGLPDQRFILSYDTGTDKISSNSIIAFSNEPLPYYARAMLLSNQFILTRRSVTDSDADHFFQSPFFLNPRGKVSDIFRLNFVYGAKDGIVLTQNIDTANGSTYYGGGIGYKFGRITPVARVQSGKNGRTITTDINFSY